MKFALRWYGNARKYPNYVIFKDTDDYPRSKVGMVGGAQEILIKKGNKWGTVAHEIGHAAGLEHEHKRSDRDEYITVFENRILSKRKHDFHKFSKQYPLVINVGEYDYNSIMHYSEKSHTKAKDTYSWSSGWSTVAFYTINNVTYLFLLKRKNGTVHVHKMSSKGTVGARTDTRDWSSGWTQAVPFVVGTKNFLFLLKKSSGRTVIHKLDSDGKIGTKVKEYNWSSGWSTVAFYVYKSKTYLILLKKDNGQIHIQKMNSDGTVGSRTHTLGWSVGWTSVVPFKEDSKSFLFLLKKEKGTTKINKIKKNGKIGKQVKRIPLIKIKLPNGESFKKSGKFLGQRKGLSSGDISTINFMYG